MIKAILGAITITLAANQVAMADAGSYDDKYISRSTELVQYERIFAAGKEAGKTVIVENLPAPQIIVPDLSGGVPPIKNEKTLGSDIVAASNASGSSVIDNLATKAMAPGNSGIQPPATSIAGRETVQGSFKGAIAFSDHIDSDAFKNEIVHINALGADAKNIAGLAAMILPVEWAVEARFATAADQRQTYELAAAAESRDKVLTELFRGTGYVFTYGFEIRDAYGKPTPILFISKEGE